MTKNLVDWDWWKHASFYHIYVKSFKDSNNDGIGDIRGIVEKLDHFSESGVDAIFLSPIFASPQIDQGYDISDFCDVDPIYGSLNDLEELIHKSHDREIKLLLDFVPNHTSDQHQWFIDSVNGIEDYKDYYVWADPQFDEQGNRKPPNNWLSVFDNSAWEWNDKRQQYYFHQFDVTQPDLNFYNPKVVKEMKDILLFWLDFGVDGFRVDAIPYIFEHQDLLDEPKSHFPNCDPTNFDYLQHIYTKDQKETYDLMHEWRKLIDDYSQKHGGNARILMTEAYTTLHNTMLYFGTPDGSKLGAHFTFNFNLVGDVQRWASAYDIVESINKWLREIPEIYASSWVLSNHDNHRVATRCGSKNVDGFNMLKAILPGIDVTYYGEEIGQENGEILFEENQDIKAKTWDLFQRLGRDFERTPFHWDDSNNAGFNDGAKPWLPVSKKYKETNLKKQKESEGLSHYKIFQALNKIRKDPVLISGNVLIKALNEHTIFVKRSYNCASVILIFNKSEYEVFVNVDEDISTKNCIELKSVDSSRELKSAINPSAIQLEPHEALLVFC
ncbi:maltase 2-like [Tribolium madens]|uniref:maltase 2-like n=1 Tax=Tribolium madens TaxID=41895 RepID=UPI001CF75BDD|nr:maltase 2-like [Tribolium madens]